jgi:hypothetical protein
MSKSPWSQIRQATPEILVVTRRGVRRVTAWRRPLGRFLFANLPEVLATVGVVVVITATWIIHPIAGAYVAGGAGLGAAWLVALGRRT